MAAKKTIKKQDIKDWFVIQRIRILNIIKEHKYLSAGIGVFLLSCIVYLIAFATTDPYEGKVTTTAAVTQKGVATTTQVDEIKSFSKLVYEVSYELFVDEVLENDLIRNEVIIEATFNEGIDASWVLASDEFTSYRLSDDKRTLTVTLYSIKVGEKNTKQLYLKVNNIKDDGDVQTKEVITKIKVKESTSEFSEEITKGASVINDKEVPLTYKLISGEAYNSKKCDNGRCVPFGIVLGFDKENLSINSNNVNMEGLYFDTQYDFVFTATDNNQSQLDILLDKDSYGLYNSDLNLINDMPLENPMIGNVTLSTSAESGATGTTSTAKTPKFYLLGEKTVTLKVDETYEELGIRLEEENEAFCIESDRNCTRTITKDGVQENEISTEEEGTYIITYEYYEGDFRVVLKRTVKVEGDKQNIELADGEIYSLIGNENIVLVKGNQYKELGIEPSIDYETEILYEDEEDAIEEVDTNKTGTYTITYTIYENDEDGEEIEHTLTRTVEVVDELTKVANQVLSASTVYAETSSDFVLPSPKLDNEYISSVDDYEVTYYNITDTTLENPLTSVDSSKNGAYYVLYSVVDKNGFILEVISTLNFQTMYKLSVKDIKINGEINYYNDDFVVIGTYFVNVNSVREENDKEDIFVTLFSGEQSASSVNKYYSEGTKINNLTFYTDEYNTLKEVSEKDKIAYGETVILKSQIEYLKNGDDNLTDITNTIDLSNGIFTKEYYDALSDLEYYLSINGKRIVSMNEDGTLNYEAGEDSEGNIIYEQLDDVVFEIEFAEHEGKLSAIMYSIDELSPGSIVDFRVRLTNGIYEHSVVTANVSSNITYTQQTEKNLSSNASIFLTPFKARGELYINNCNYDVIINGADRKDQVSVWSLYPSLVMPAEIINTNAAGVNVVDTVKITITLPREINYIYNENYTLPDNVRDAVNNDGVTTLVYTLKNKQVNEWIDPIVFETNYDVDTLSGSDLVVTAVIEATTANGIKDVSDIDLRTAKRKITYQNNEELATSMYTTHQAISKDTSFDINTVIYKNTNKDYENLELITILPYNDGSKENNFSGIYEIIGISEGAYCTDLPNIKELNFTDEEIWSDCEDYMDDNYQGITAIKEIVPKLDDSNRYFSSNIELQPIGNKSDDNYTTMAYIIDNNANKIIEIPSLTVSVISKKIQGIVWEDFDANGLMDKSEKHIPDIKFNLYDADTDELVKSTLSDPTGKYVLSDLDVGRYYIVAEYNTSKYGFTTPFIGANNSLNSSFDSYGNSDSIMLSDEDEEHLDDDEDIWDDDDNYEDDENGWDDEDDEDEQDNSDVITPTSVIRSDIIEVTENTKVINNINLGLTLRKEYSVKLSKYITKAVVTNNLGVATARDYGKATLAKLDVKDINNLNIKVVYTLELENIGHYPGYIYNVKDYIPDGMKFNEEYEENKGWILNEEGYVENNTLFNELIYSGDKKYLTIAFDITRKEAGAFINYAVVDDEDLQILVLGQ